MPFEREVQGDHGHPWSPWSKHEFGTSCNLQVHSYDGGAFKSKGQYDIKPMPQFMFRCFRVVGTVDAFFS